MPEPNERKAGYEAGLMTAGSWMKGRVVGFILNEHIILGKEVKLEDGQQLFKATKEELEELTEGRMPNAS